jgi:hypothetical protein
MGIGEDIDNDESNSKDKNWTTRYNNENVFDTLYNDVTTHAPEGRILYLSRHGESESNRHLIIGVRILRQRENVSKFDQIRFFFSLLT